MSAAKRPAPHAVALTLLAVASAPAGADVYKCAGEGRTPVYQEMPCAPGKELRNFQTDPPPITILPPQSRPGAASPAAKSAPAADAKPGTDARPGKSAIAAGDASERKFVRLGMTEAEVLAKLGQPDMSTTSRTGGAVRWTYMPAPGDPETVTALTLAKGTVVDIERKVVKK
jgi:hypothetical protein